MRLRAKEIGVPDAEQRQQHRHVGFERRAEEMFVHGARAREQFLEPVHADGDGHGQSHRPPDRIAPAHPVPQREAQLGRDAEGGCSLGIGGDRGEMFFHRSLAPQRLGEPGFGQIRVGQGLAGGEGLGGDDEQRRLRLRLRQRAREVVRIGIGDKRKRLRRIRLAPERPGEHARAEVGAADADVDHRAHRLAAMAQQALAANGVAEGAHALLGLAHQRHDIAARREHLQPGAQRHVQHGAVFGVIDMLAFEHARAPALDPGLPRQIDEQRERGVGYAVLGVIEQQRARLQAEFLRALGVAREQIAHAHVRHFGLVRVQRFPRGAKRKLTHGVVFSFAYSRNFSVRSPARLPSQIFFQCPTGPGSRWPALSCINSSRQSWRAPISVRSVTMPAW